MNTGDELVPFSTVVPYLVGIGAFFMLIDAVGLYVIYHLWNGDVLLGAFMISALVVPNAAIIIATLRMLLPTKRAMSPNASNSNLA